MIETIYRFCQRCFRTKSEIFNDTFVCKIVEYIRKIGDAKHCVSTPFNLGSGQHAHPFLNPNYPIFLGLSGWLVCCIQAIRDTKEKDQIHPKSTVHNRKEIL